MEHTPNPYRMQDLIYTLYHNKAVERNAVDDMWNAALTTISAMKFPKFDRLRSACFVLLTTISESEKTEKV